MDTFNALLEQAMTRRGARRQALIGKLREHVQDLRGHEDEIQHLRYENKAQRAILADKERWIKELLESKKELQELKKSLQLKQS